MRKRRYPWLRIRPGARWPKGNNGANLLRRLDDVGAARGRLIRVDSGLRSPYEQWRAYQDFLRGGNLAAPCCSRHWLHSWEECLRQCGSNHCISRAVDASISTGRKPGPHRPRTSTEFQSIGLDVKARAEMHRVGLCLPVGVGEVWHVEVGNAWRS